MAQRVRKAVQVPVVSHLGQAARLPGDVGDDALFSQPHRPAGRERLSITQVAKDGGVLLAGALFEILWIPVRLPVLVHEAVLDLVIAVDEGAQEGAIRWLQPSAGVELRGRWLGRVQVEMPFGVVAAGLQLLHGRGIRVAQAPVDLCLAPIRVRRDLREAGRRRVGQPAIAGGTRVRRDRPLQLAQRGGQRRGKVERRQPGHQVAGGRYGHLLGFGRMFGAPASGVADRWFV